MSSPRGLVIALLLVVLLGSLPVNPQEAVAQTGGWQRVNPSGFGGDYGTSYSSPVVFNNNIYVATAKEFGGNFFTEIWRSPVDGAVSWSRVVTNGITGQLGAPSNTGAVFELTVGSDNNLYLTNDPNTSSLTCENDSCRMVWRSSNGTTWNPVSPNNFTGIGQTTVKKSAKTRNGDIENNLAGFNSGKIIRFNGRYFLTTAKHVDFSLGGAVAPECGKAEIYSSADGQNWEAEWDDGGIGDAFTCSVSSLAIFNGELYASTIRWGTVGRNSQLFKLDTSPDRTARWVLATADEYFRDGGIITHLSTLSSIDGDEFFAGVFFRSGQPAAVYRSLDGRAWSPVTSSANISGSGNLRISAMQTYPGQIIVSTYNPSIGAQVWHSAPRGPQWVQLNPDQNGFGSPNNPANSRVTGVIRAGNYFWATTWNTSSARGVQVWRRQIIEPPEPKCILDIQIILDLSGSMNSQFINSDPSRSKLQVAKDVLLGTASRQGLLEVVKNNQNGSRIALTTFNGDGQNPPRFLTTRSVFRDQMGGTADFFDPDVGTNYAQMQQAINNLTAVGGTPMAHSLRFGRDVFQNRVNSKPPLLIFIGDGAPTFDIHRSTVPPALHEYSVNHTDNISTRLGNDFRPADEVRLESGGGAIYNWPDGFSEYAGAAVADMMEQAQELFRTVGDIRAYAVSLQSSGGTSFNKSTLEYIGSHADNTAPNGGTINTDFNVYDPSNIDEFFDNITNIIQYEACNSLFIADLPPRSLIKPSELYFNENYYTIAGENITCDSARSQNCQAYDVSLQIVPDPTNDDPIFDHYRINVKKYIRGQGRDSSTFDGNPVFGYRISFTEPISAASVTQIDNALVSAAVQPFHVFHGNTGCAAELLGNFVCLRTEIITDVPSLTGEQPLYLFQKINRDKIIIQGNVAAPGLLNNFSLQGGAIAAGGNITIRGCIPSTPSNCLNSYLSDIRTISWKQVSGQLAAVHSKGMIIGTGISTDAVPNGPVGGFTGSTWYLNSATTDPRSSAASTFASPPEGKIWKRDGNLSFVNPVTFQGAGTVVVRGNLNINRPLSCTNQRLAFIVTGNININTNQIGCGAYIALGGNITFQDTTHTPQPIKGIFIAQGNIDLPSATALTGAYIINYDDILAKNPTVLLKDVLELIITASS